MILLFLLVEFTVGIMKPKFKRRNTMDEFTAKWNVLHPEEEAKRQIDKINFIVDLTAAFITGFVVTAIVCTVAKKLGE